MKFIAAALSLPLLVASQKLDTNAVKIASVSYSGNGCPQGSATTMISDDRTVSLFHFYSRLSPPILSLSFVHFHFFLNT